MSILRAEDLYSLLSLKKKKENVADICGGVTLRRYCWNKHFGRFLSCIGYIN